ncbi:hypothetical protein [Helicobacter pylori]|uniref:hypothetical protein n=1 Tax=Helicobacter pylori TaxID=210 RepID=UPI00026A7236|nr:hypothetical protein [Helicobacter pylori]EJB15184.1 hypothetical protein HPCPY1124_1077 [Helicobacter pylori CPY1124]WRF55761.1 hypothetical protein E5E41_02375 [Helicobacter pylori]BAW63894.1 uncharacterized protein HPF75_0482 [Helicobacter pylori]GHP25308.1 hypothetical protein JP0038_02210 [Helicobacter pylori]GHP35169.1 hypothetical protein JP0040_05570 [Helicobacter pylori]
MKALARVDNNVKMNANNIITLDEDTYNIAKRLTFETEQLEKEVAKLKQQLKKPNQAKK